jgi:hypothetical protein
VERRKKRKEILNTSQIRERERGCMSLSRSNIEHTYDVDEHCSGVYIYSLSLSVVVIIIIIIERVQREGCKLYA